MYTQTPYIVRSASCTLCGWRFQPGYDQLIGGAACVTRTHDPRIHTNYNFHCHHAGDVCGLDFLFPVANLAVGGSCKVSTLIPTGTSTGLPTADLFRFTRFSDLFTPWFPKEDA